MKISENEHLLAYSMYNSMHDFKNKSIIMTLSISKVSCGEWNLNRNFPALFKCKGCRKRGVYLLVFRQRNTRNKILLSSTGQRSSNHFLVSVGAFSFSTKNAWNWTLCMYTYFSFFLSSDVHPGAAQKYKQVPEHFVNNTWPTKLRINLYDYPDILAAIWLTL